MPLYLEMKTEHPMKHDSLLLFPKRSQRLLGAISLVLCIFAVGARAQTTAFTFQGRLNDNGVPATGSYDLQLKLYDTAATGTGTQVGSTITLSSVPVTNGVFTVQPDFTANVFPGADRFVEVGVKPAFQGVIPTSGNEG